MNTNIELKKANGEIIKVELISYFEHIPTSKKYIFYTLNHQESHTAKSKEEICASDNVINCSVCVNGEMSCNYIDSAGYADPEKYLTCPCGGSNEE